VPKRFFEAMEKPVFLVTRPAAEAKATARKLDNLGIKPIIESCFSIRFLPAELPVYKSNKLIIITSINGARAFGKICADYRWKILTVGEKAAKFLRGRSFANIVHVAENVDELVKFVKLQFPPCHSRVGGNPYSRDGEVLAVVYRPVVMDSRLRGNDKSTLGIEFIYARGNKVRKNLKTALKKFSVTDIILYETVEKKSLSAQTIQLIKNEKISGILFYSAIK